MVILKSRHPHAAKLERWLGASKIASLQAATKGWYSHPIHLLDVPGSVRIAGDGDFVGPFRRGYFMSALDVLEAHIKKLTRVSVPQSVCYSGFASISDALSRASGGFRQPLLISKTIPVGVTSGHHTWWRQGGTPAAGTTPSAAPGGNAPTVATAGAIIYTNPASGTMHLTGADMNAQIVNQSILIYDRLFHVAKTMASTATEAVTGVPVRYTSTTPGAADYAGGNFLFAEVGATVLGSGAHNITVCQYTDQDGNTGANLPSVAGINTCPIDRVDTALNNPFFYPLASGDSGIKNLTQMQLDASIATGTLYFVIGHPIGIMMFPVINTMFPFDWLTSRDLAPRIFDSACLTGMSINEAGASSTNYNGILYITSAA